GLNEADGEMRLQFGIPRQELRSMRKEFSSSLEILLREGNLAQVQVDYRVIGRALQRLFQMLAGLRKLVQIVLIDAQVFERWDKCGIALQCLAEIVVGPFQIALAGVREAREVEHPGIGGPTLE